MPVKYCPLCGKEYSDAEVCPEDGAVLIQTQQDADLLLGQVLKGSYRIEEKIGAGGMGQVYRAVQMPLGRDVAVKSLLPSLQSTPSMVQRFFQEAKLLSQLSHPNVVAIIDFGNTETGMIYMVMEYLDGSPLSRIVPRGKGLPLDRTLRLMRQACAGVGAAHRCNLVHRDLKPDNIFVCSATGGQELVKVLDFGIARVIEAEQQTRLTQTGLLIGTPGYIAPEQIEASEADARSDVYALGAILYYMLTGRSPYHGATPHSILVKQLQATPAMDPGLLGKPLARVVLRRCIGIPRLVTGAPSRSSPPSRRRPMRRRRPSRCRSAAPPGPDDLATRRSSRPGDWERPRLRRVAGATGRYGQRRRCWRPSPSPSCRGWPGAAIRSPRPRLGRRRRALAESPQPGSLSA